MNVLNCRISEFANRVGKKHVICFGAGWQATEMCENHNEILNKIDFFIDNDISKHGAKVLLEKSYDVKGTDALNDIDCNNVVFIIATSFFDEVLSQLDALRNVRDCECYIYKLMEILEENSVSFDCAIECNSKEPISKVIHYCWFGRGEKGELVSKCIDSWKKFCPDYTIIEWNEDNFDININDYVKEAYDSKKYAFVSDYFRLWVLYNYGGIYMDTDVEVVKPLDELLFVEAFSGFETLYSIPTGILAAKKYNGWVKRQLDAYIDEHFVDESGKMRLITNVDRITKISKDELGFVANGKKQVLKYGMMLYPKEVFCPKSPGTGIINVTDNTYTIHHFSVSWYSDDAREKMMSSKDMWRKYSYLCNREERCGGAN